MPLLTYTSNYYPVKGGHTYQAFNDFKNEDALDIVFVGSSHAYRGFDPRIFKKYGYNTFNLGTSGQNLESSEIIIEQLLSKKKVKTILLEIFSSQLEKSDASLESSIDIAFNSPDYTFNKNFIISRKDWRFVNLCLYKLFSSSANPVYIDSTYVGKGFSENKATVKDTVFKYKSDFVSDNNCLLTLENIIRLTKKNHQQLILVSHPLPGQYPESKHNKFKSFIEPLIKKYNVPYFDYTVQPGLLASKHFYDYNHLNQAGVTIFDSILINNPDFVKLLNENKN